MKRYLITGSTGYIGSRLMDRLAGQPETMLYGLTRNDEANTPERLQLKADLVIDEIEHLLRQARPDVIFHAVGASPLASFQDQMLAHVEGTRRLMQAIADTEQKPHVIIVGSAAEYGLRLEAVNEDAQPQPEGDYGVCKIAQHYIARSFARRYDIPVTCARVFNVYGETAPGLVVASLASQVASIQQGAPPVIEAQNLASARDFIHVDDVVEALLALSEQTPAKGGETFNVASGVATRVKQVLELLLKEAAIEDVEVHANGPQTSDVSRADISRIYKHAGWRPRITLPEGMARELEYWQTRQKAPVS